MSTEYIKFKSHGLVLIILMSVLNINFSFSQTAQEKAMTQFRATKIVNRTPYTYSYAEAVELLLEMKDSIPDHKSMTESLPEFIKKRDIISKIKIKPSDPYKKPGSGAEWYSIDVSIKNGSKETIKRFVVDSKRFDSDGNLISESRSFINATGRIKLEPKPGEEGAQPKYKGVAKDVSSIVGADGGNEWDRTEIILREIVL